MASPGVREEPRARYERGEHPGVGDRIERIQGPVGHRMGILTYPHGVGGVARDPLPTATACSANDGVRGPLKPG